MRTFALIVVLGVGLIFLAGNSIDDAGDNAVSSGVNTASLTFCTTKSAKARRVLDYWTSAGVIRKSSEDSVTVDEIKWRALEHDMKVSIGLATYCKQAVAQSGRNTAYIRGLRDNEIHASVNQGHSFD